MGTIRKRGDSYEVDYRIGGIRKRRAYPSKVMAEEFIEMLDKKKTLAELGVSFELSDLVVHDLKTALHRYYEIRTSKKARDSRNMEKKIFAEMYQYLNVDRDVDNVNEVTAEMMESYRDTMKDVAASTVNRRFASIKNFFNTCVDWEYIEYSPCRRLKLLKIKQVDRKLWSTEQIGDVLKALPAWAREIVIFFVNTGARPGEISSLTWGDIDFTSGSLTLRSGKNLDGVRTFPISIVVYEQLKRLKTRSQKQSDFVFKNSRGNQFTTDNLGKVFRKTKVLGSDYVLYGLRHTFCTNLAMNNVNQEQVRKLAGHQKMVTTQKYMKINAAELGGVLDKHGLNLAIEGSQRA